jgi:hypothetical protein
LFDARWRALDASANPLSGATLTVYNANTVVLTPLFSDVGLSVALANPVTADSAGRFGQIFAAEGTTVDLVLKDSGGSTVYSEDDVAFLGADTGTFSRTLADNTRYKISGSGGVVLIEVGDPSPDNIGGTVTFQGWAGTQGDTATFNFATVNAGTSAGALKENGKKITGTIYVDSTQVTAQTSVDIALPQSPSGARAWEIELWNYSQSGNGNLQARLSYDGGGTFKSAGTDYKYYYEQSDSTTGALSVTALVTAAAAQFCSNLNSATDELGRVRLRIITPDSGTTHTSLDFDCRGVLNTGAFAVFKGLAYGAGSYGRATHLRLLMSASNFTFKYRVVPLRGYGET